jgi:hypothetical protein
VVAASIDEPTPAQAGQVVGHPGLRLGEPAGQLAGRQLAVGLRQLEETEASVPPSTGSIRHRPR